MGTLKGRVLKLENISDGFFCKAKVFAVIGFFDGVHLGHAKIIKECMEKAAANGGVSAVFTFDAPPVNIIKGRLDKKLITSFADKIRLLRQTGLDYVIVARFDREFAELNPEEFCREILVKKLNVKEIFIGESFRFGRNSSGDIDFLKRYFNGSGVNINEIKILKMDGTPVSSTVIRGYYNRGDIDSIAKLLGRKPFIKGVVIHGDKRGRLLGFPTANIDVFEKYVTPEDGVYAGYVNMSGSKECTRFPSVINIGNNPTFMGKRKWVEVHIIDFCRDIYNRKIEVTFVKRLRDEMTFSGKDDLVGQIKCDIEHAKKLFENFFRN
jgi:riboflavin kinase / FMN adenylyltransferase